MEDRYNRLIRELAKTFLLAEARTCINPTEEALKLLNEHYNAIVRRRRRGGDLHAIKNYASRWNEHVWRIAVILHALKFGNEAGQHSLDGDGVLPKN